MPTSEHEVSRLLRQWVAGDEAALGHLTPLIYNELHKMAKRYMSKRNHSNTLQTTALIHEAYLKLAGDAGRNWQGRAHFFAVAAKTMRNVLVDYARARQTAKRGGHVRVVPLDEAVVFSTGFGPEIVALDQALSVLASSDPRKAQVVELRYFGGLSVDDTAKLLDVSPETVARDWRFAKSFLRRELVNEDLKRRS
jgi:RNA polymerase sigma-70 factor (ECF subfamily)